MARTVSPPFRGLILLLAAILLPATHGAGLAAQKGSGGSSSRKDPSRKVKKAFDNGAILGEVNGEKVTLGELRERMASTEFRHARAFQGDNAARRMAYRELVNDRLVVQYMREEGKRRPGDTPALLEMARNVALANGYLRAVRQRYVPSDNEVRQYLPRYMRTIDIRLYIDGSYSGAVDARERVAQGEDFGKIVRERSVGPGAERGGMLPGYRSPGILPGHIESQAFAAPEGWLSPVFETGLGYCFLRLEKVRDFTAAEVSRIAASAVESARNAAAKGIVDNVTASARVEKEEDTIRGLASLAPEEWEERGQEVFARVDGAPIRLADLRRFILVVRKGVFPAPGSADVSTFADALPKVIVFAGRAKEEGMDRDPGFKAWARKEEEAVLNRRFREEVAAGVTVGEAEARDYFDRNRERWKRPEAREVRYVEAGTPEVASAIAAMVREDPSAIDRFAKAPEGAEYGSRVWTIYRGGNLAPGSEKWIFEAPVGELVGPREFNGRWLLLLVDRTIPPLEDPRFEDNEEAVRGALRKERVERAVRERKEELYRKAAVVTNTEVLEAAEW